MSKAEFFRRRELQCHQSVSTINDRSSYVARRVTELDVLSAIGSVVNASGGSGLARFVHCEATRTTWLRSMERALLERHLSRLLQFSLSLEDTCKRFCSDTSDVREGLDEYNALIHYTVFALIDYDYEEFCDAAMRPEVSARMLCCARQKALPMLVAWILGEDITSFQQLMAGCGTQHKVFATLRRSVRQELEVVREFITNFLCALEQQSTEAGVPTATHIPETFICDGGVSTSNKSGGMLSFKNELDELRSLYEKNHDGPNVAILKDLIDPSLRCRVYCDNKNSQTKYQWLPTEFQVGVDGAVLVLSPLHGSVHPHHFPGLYAVIPQLFGQLLPLFERVLGSIATQVPPQPHQVGLGSTSLPTGNRTVCTKPNTQFELKNRQLQVVVKLSTIHLDTDHPVFTGEQDHANSNRGWQLDSDDHEHIVAVGYHILRSRNIATPMIAFRAFSHSSTTPEDSSQEDTFLAFGERTSSFHDGRYGRQFLQPWGLLALHEGRSIAVPRFLVHRMEPFELLDTANPDGGELTIATFYLVDPTRKPIVSTRTVRPEQWQQSQRFIQASVDMLQSSPVLPYLPDEVTSRIADFAASHRSESHEQQTRQQLHIHRQKLQELRFVTPSLRLEEMKLDLDA